MADLSIKRGQLAMVVFYVAIWYAGNILYIIYNDQASVAFANPPPIDPKTRKMVVGAHPDKAYWAMSVATGQLAVGVLYALYMWIMGGRAVPKINFADFMQMVPAGACSALAHASSVFALSVGGIAFGSIVKAAEPVFSAIIVTTLDAIFPSKDGKKNPDVPNIAQFLCFIPIVGGIAIASLTFDPKTFAPSINKDFFSMAGLLYACAANIFAAFKGIEGKKIKNDKDLSGKLGNETNAFAVFGIISLLISIPLMLVKEGQNAGGMKAFYDLIFNSKLVENGKDILYKGKVIPNYSGLTTLLLSGLTFYLYNEAVFLTIWHETKNPMGMDPVVNSVANTAKRVVVIGMGPYVQGKPPLVLSQYIGCGICIVGVFLYSMFKDHGHGPAHAPEAPATGSVKKTN